MIVVDLERRLVADRLRLLAVLVGLDVAAERLRVEPLAIFAEPFAKFLAAAVFALVGLVMLLRLRKWVRRVTGTTPGGG